MEEKKEKAEEKKEIKELREDTKELKKEVQKINLEKNYVDKKKIIFDDTIKVEALKKSNSPINREKDSSIIDSIIRTPIQVDSISVAQTDSLEQTLDSLKLGVFKIPELDSVIIK